MPSVNPLGSAGLLFICLCKLGTTGAGSTLPQDLSDIQWREFRAGLPALAALFLPAAAASRLLQQRGVTITTRLRAYLLLSLAFLGALTPQCVRQRCMLALGSACHSSCKPSQSCAVKRTCNPCTVGGAGYLHGACTAFLLALVLASFAVAQVAAGQPWG